MPSHTFNGPHIYIPTQEPRLMCLGVIRPLSSVAFYIRLASPCTASWKISRPCTPLFLAFDYAWIVDLDLLLLFLLVSLCIIFSSWLYHLDSLWHFFTPEDGFDTCPVIEGQHTFLHSANTSIALQKGELLIRYFWNEVEHAPWIFSLDVVYVRRVLRCSRQVTFLRGMFENLL